MNKNLSTVIKIAISGLLLYLVLRRVDFSEVAHSWRRYSAYVIVSVIGLHLLALIVNTVKWKIFLPGQGFLQLLRFTFINCFYAMALPGQLTGEVAKAYRLGRRVGDVKTVSLSVLFDKLTGIVGLLNLMFIGLLLSSRNLPHILYFTAGLVVLTALFSMYAAHIPFFVRVVETVTSPLPGKTRDFAASIMASLQQFDNRPIALISNILLGALYQLISIAIIMTFARELRIAISVIDWFWIFGVVSIIQFLPISIAGLGVREVSLVGILGLFLVPAPAALALSFSIFGIQLLYALIGAAVEAHYNVVEVSRSYEGRRKPQALGRTP
jgi:glycosyltransferase 2 family protein